VSIARRRRTRTRVAAWASRGVAAGLLTFGALLGGVVNAGSAAAATTINCDTAAQPSTSWTTCQKLTGTAKCVWNNKDGTYTLAVGYTNPTSNVLFASVPNTGTNTGANNAFTATSGFAANPGHSTTFYIGTFTTAWTVTWTPSSKTDGANWLLMGKNYVWYDTYTACPSKPVPVIGNGIIGSMGVVMITGYGLLNRRRLKEFLAGVRLVGSSAS
jgi:hypothetical protein